MNEQLKAVTVMIRANQSLQEVLKLDIESYGLNTTEFGTLEYLYHKGNQPIQKICRKLLMANSSMTYVIDKLEEKGLVRRVQDPNDRRSTVVELTDKGLSLITTIFPQHEERVKEIFSVLTDEELNQLLELLKKVGKHSDSLVESTGK